MDTATNYGAGEDGSVDFAADELFRRLEKEDPNQVSEDETDEHTPRRKKKPEEPEPEDTSDDSGESPEDEGDTQEDEGDEEETDESDEDDDEESEKPSKPGKRVILEPDSDAYVKHKVDGKELEIKVSDLTRLYGQEAALTRKSQEAASLRKESEDRLSKLAIAHNEMLERAKARWEPYSKINWVALTKDPNVSQEELSALHNEAQKVWDDLNYHATSLDAAFKQSQQDRHESLVKQGQEAWKVLADPKTGIEGWGEKLYQEVTSFARQSGIDDRVVRELVDPNAIKLLHMAMLYSKGKAAVKSAKAVNKTPKRVVKSASEPVRENNRRNAPTKAEKRLRASGDVDDAAALLLERWGN